MSTLNFKEIHNKVDANLKECKTLIVNADRKL